MPAPAVDDVRLRHLMVTIRHIQETCCVQEKKAEEKRSSDNFVNAKEDLSEFLHHLKDDIAKAISDSKNDAKKLAAISEKHKCQKAIDQAKADWNELKRLHTAERTKFDKKKSKLTVETIEDREKIVQAFNHIIVGLENDLKGRRNNKQRFDLARRAKEQAQKERDFAGKDAKSGKGGIGSEVSEVTVEAPLSSQEQAFMEKKEQNDVEIEQLELQLLKGVRETKKIAQNINQELKTQEIVLNDVEKVMDKVSAKIQSANARMTELLVKSGGVNRWCPVVICLILLLALCGYLYNMFMA